MDSSGLSGLGFVVAHNTKSEEFLVPVAVRLALFAGMRRGELFRLQWDHIDFERGFSNLVDTKGGVDNIIPLNADAREVLKQHPRMEHSSYVFPGREGGQRVDINKTVNRIKKRAGLPKNFRALHGLRHVYASALASCGKVDMYGSPSKTGQGPLSGRKKRHTKMN